MRAAAVAGPHAVAAVAPVQLHQVNRQYGTGEARVQALDDVSVTFPPGSWTAGRDQAVPHDPRRRP